MSNDGDDSGDGIVLDAETTEALLDLLAEMQASIEAIGERLEKERHR